MSGAAVGAGGRSGAVWGVRPVLRRVGSVLFALWLVAAAGCDEGAREAPGADAASAVPEREASPGGGSPGAAVAVIRDYYAAIAAGDYAGAYRYWASGGAASGQTFEEFRRGFAGTASVRVEVGEPGRIEGAAGSRYISIPVEVHATTTAGAAQCFRGSYTLRRVVVPGASEEMRRWRIHSAELRECGAGSGP